jgi:hypothetical protein
MNTRPRAMSRLTPSSIVHANEVVISRRCARDRQWGSQSVLRCRSIVQAKQLTSHNCYSGKQIGLRRGTNLFPRSKPPRSLASMATTGK